MSFLYVTDYADAACPQGLAGAASWQQEPSFAEQRWRLAPQSTTTANMLCASGTPRDQAPRGWSHKLRANIATVSGIARSAERRCASATSSSRLQEPEALSRPPLIENGHGHRSICA